MNYNLLYCFNKNNLNTGIIKQNINNITNILYNIDPLTEKAKYLSLSCIYGAFFGDAIGANCEFLFPSTKNHLNIYQNYKGSRFLPGEITDDSELAMSAAFAYMDANDQNDSRIQDLMYYYFGIWKESGPKDMGSTTLNSLKYFNSSYSIDQIKFDKIKPSIQKNNWNSLSNGVLMRLSTFIVFYFYTNFDKVNSIIQNFFNITINTNEIDNELLNLIFDIFYKVKKNSEITHPNPEIAISASFFSLMVLAGMVRNNAKEIYSLFKMIALSKKFTENNENKDFNAYAQAIQKKFVRIIYEIEKNEKNAVYNLMGYYMHAFKLSIYYLYKITKGQIKDQNLYYYIMCEICNLGGDTDTNCAIVGTMIGPLVGYKNFQPQLFDKFLKFYPENRTQYTSAFMYIYVNYLEEKYLYKKKYSNNEKENTYPAYTKLFQFLKNPI